MASSAVAVLIFTIFSNLFDKTVASNAPTQVHLSFGKRIDEIVVTWSTTNATNSLVQYGVSNWHLSNTAYGNSIEFVDDGPESHKQFIHRASLTKLTSHQLYYYRCGNGSVWSETFRFYGPHRNENASPEIALFGDMGLENAVTLALLENETKSGMFDAIFHVGDFAYDMDSQNGKIGDKFMDQIEPIAAFVPYMTCVGNHEEKYNFSHYRKRFNMPSDNEGLYYSFDFGPAHFIFISTEVYYFLQYGLKMLVKQYDWLENDLRLAAKPENIEKRPWIVILGHRPMYCSNDNDDNCVGNHTLTRKGFPLIGLGLEDLLHEYKVDVGIWAHEHSYERFWPMYNYTVYNGSRTEPYRHSEAVVHLVTGSAGCKEGREAFKKDKPPYSAFRSNDYGFTRLKIFNSTHLYFEQISADRNGSVIDSFFLIK